MATDKPKIIVDISCCLEGVDADISKLKELAVHICCRFSIVQAIISVAIVDDEVIKQVNSDYLKSQKLTDVISFDLSEEDEEAKSYEIIINAQQAMRQAAQRGHSSEAELALYLTHGLLHNLGLDDADKAEAERMHDMEDEILQQAGFGVVYNRSIKND